MATLAQRQIIGKKLYYLKRPTKWDKGIGVYLPEAYKKFFYEWKLKKPEPVHYIEQKGRYCRDENTGVVSPVQNVPIPLRFPDEYDKCLWGGEGIIQGFTKKDRYSRRVPKFWFPNLKMSVIHSEVLDVYIKTIVTDRTLNLIHSNYGLDHYILKTPACDLKSLLGIKLKKRILTALATKSLYPNDPVKREEIYNTYKKYLTDYTPEEIEWYGLTFEEACRKWQNENLKEVKPLKIQFREKLIQELKDQNTDRNDENSLLSKISSFNPFKSKSITE